MPVRDLTFRVTDVPDRGAKENASEFIEIAGGNAPNAAISISRLGGRVLLTGPMGGRQATSSAYIYDALGREGIDTSGLVTVDDVVTPISTIMIAVVTIGVLITSIATKTRAAGVGA